MKKSLLIILLSIIFTFKSSWADQEIVVIQSVRIKPYEEAIEGFKSVCRSRIQRLVLSELKGTEVIRKINAVKPDLVLAVGKAALLAAKAFRNIPVVYVMVLNPESVLSGEKNITGVSMNIPQEKQLAVLMGALPYTKTIGLLYDPNRTGRFVENVEDIAGHIGVRLIANEVYNSKDVPSAIMQMKGKIDVFWMLPDITVITPETIEFLLLFSLENKIPVFTFSEKYVEMGAFMSMEIDAFDMGRQAGEMVGAMQEGKDMKDISPVYARKAVVSTNLMVARKIGIVPAIAMKSRNDMNTKVFRETRSMN